MARFKVTARVPKTREGEVLGIKKAPVPAPRRLYCRALRVPERPLTGNDETPDPATTAPKRFQIRPQPPVSEAVQPVVVVKPEPVVKVESDRPRAGQRSTVAMMKHLQIDPLAMLHASPEEVERLIHHRFAGLLSGDDTGVLLEVWYHKKNTIRYYTIPPGQLSPDELNLLQQQWAGDDFDFWGYVETEVLDSRIAERLEQPHLKEANDLARRTQHLAMRLGLIAGRNGVAEDLRRYEQRGGVMESCSIELPLRCQLIRILLSE